MPIEAGRFALDSINATLDLMSVQKTSLTRVFTSKPVDNKTPLSIDNTSFLPQIRNPSSQFANSHACPSSIHFFCKGCSIGFAVEVYEFCC